MKIAKYILPVVFMLFSLGIFGIQGAQAVTKPGIEGTIPLQVDLGIGETCFSSDECGGAGAVCHKTDKYCYFPLGEGPQGIGEILQIITTIGNWIFGIFMAISVIFILWGAFEFVTGGGDPEKVSSAKKRLLYAAIGIALALLANGVDDILRNILIR